MLAVLCRFSEIFCYGELLDAAQHAYIHNDSKSFVDMKLNDDPGKQDYLSIVLDVT